MSRTRRAGIVVAVLLLPLLLAACDGDGQGPDAERATPLCLNADCGARRQLVDLPQLENIAYTAGGRLFVSGQLNLYEITRVAADAYQARALLATGGGCSGLAEQRGYLYALCPGGLHALNLADPSAMPVLISALASMTLPNGMVAGADHRLYITDGPVALEPKIVRLQLSPDDPLRVQQQDTWLLTFPEYPNGLAIRGQRLYTTLYLPPVGTVAAIDIGADGRPRPVQRLATRGIMDDLSVYGESLLIADFQNGALLQLGLDGEEQQQTGLLSFNQPSSVAVVGAPLFDTPTAVATERYLGSGLWAWVAR